MIFCMLWNICSRNIVSFKDGDHSGSTFYCWYDGRRRVSDRGRTHAFFRKRRIFICAPAVMYVVFRERCPFYYLGETVWRMSRSDVRFIWKSGESDILFAACRLVFSLRRDDCRVGCAPSDLCPVTVGVGTGSCGLFSVSWFKGGWRTQYGACSLFAGACCIDWQRRNFVVLFFIFRWRERRVVCGYEHGIFGAGTYGCGV